MAECVLELPKWHAKQLEVFNVRASEILFAGDTRAGKSFFVRKAYILWASTIPGLQLDIFRLNFDDVIKENMDGETGFPALLSTWREAGLVKINQADITFWNESKIYLEHCGSDDVMQKHQGVARHVRTFAESCQLLERRIRALTGWVTMSEEMKSRVPEKWKGLFPKVLHVTNPKGVSSPYYRKHFVEARPPGTIEQIGQHLRVYIPAFVDDNPSENKEATIARIQEAFPDAATQKSLINEDKTGISNWRSAGGEFFPEWNVDRHVVKDFIPPHWWFRFRTMDLGYAEPFAVYWIAVSDGEVFKDRQGRERWFPRGALIFYKEWYGCNPKEPAVGLRMRNEDIRDGIIARSEVGHSKDITLTDSLPFQDRGGVSVPSVFLNKGDGFTIVEGDTSRIVGWNQLRARLIGIPYDGVKIPMVYFCESCTYAIDYMPALPRHKNESKAEDAAEHGEATHAPDAIRLGCMAHTNQHIKDYLRPMPSIITREVLAKPTMNKILRNQGYGSIA